MESKSSVNLEELLPPSAYAKYSELVTALRRGALNGSYNVARQTVVLLRKVIGQTRWENGANLLDIIRAIGRGLVSAQPVELALGNITRRILYIVRHEYKNILNEQEQEKFFNNIFDFCAFYIINITFHCGIFFFKSLLLNIRISLMVSVSTHRSIISSLSVLFSFK